MSGSDRDERTEAVDDQSTWIGLSLALNLCALVLISVSWFLPHPVERDLIHENGKTYYEHYESGCREAERERAVILDSFADATTTEQQADYQKRKVSNEADITRECDMAAQYLAAESAVSMDRSNWAIMITTIVAALLIFFTLLFTRMTLGEAKDATAAGWAAVEATKKNGILERRPWVNITEVLMTSAPRFTESPPNEGHFCALNIAIKGKNIGLSPAVDVFYDFKFIAGDFDKEQVVRNFIARRYAAPTGSMVGTIFPSNDVIEITRMGFGTYVADPKFKTEGGVLAFACTYRSPEGPDFFCTPEFFNLRPLNGADAVPSDANIINGWQMKVMFAKSPHIA